VGNNGGATPKHLRELGVSVPKPMAISASMGRMVTPGMSCRFQRHVLVSVLTLMSFRVDTCTTQRGAKMPGPEPDVHEAGLVVRRR
jgi:hypothetical protein